ncbi:MAG: hypothetical protein ACT4P2_15300 [Pseudomonadota bacterium]
MWFEAFDKYRDLFIGPVNTPANGAVGIAWHVTPQTDHLAFDVKYILWQAVHAIGQGPGEGGFGGKNRPVFLVGGQHRLDESSTLRAGYDYGPSPIPDNRIFANALFPAVVEHQGGRWARPTGCARVSRSPAAGSMPSTTSRPMTAAATPSVSAAAAPASTCTSMASTSA